MQREEISTWYKDLQDQICRALEKADGRNVFREDAWERPGGGGGRSRILENGEIIEKGGVNFSEVHGDTPERILKALNIEKAKFYATGISIVIHPQSPMIPIIHMNLRYFEMSSGEWWFGGGIDLTPHYVVKEDAQLFHRKLKEVCDQFDPSYYPKFKDWADDYFFIQHRNETRGIGGIFFDHLSETDEKSTSDRFNFSKGIGELFAPLYLELIERNKDVAYDADQKTWQLLRRGRYVEFNLVYDVGTKFGLDTSGRIESILMSLPPYVNWTYNHQPQPGSEEEKTLEFLKKGINWVEE